MPGGSWPGGYSGTSNEDSPKGREVERNLWRLSHQYNNIRLTKSAPKEHRVHGLLVPTSVHKVLTFDSVQKGGHRGRTRSSSRGNAWRRGRDDVVVVVGLVHHLLARVGRTGSFGGRRRRWLKEQSTCRMRKERGGRTPNNAIRSSFIGRNRKGIRKAKRTRKQSTCLECVFNLSLPCVY